MGIPRLPLLTVRVVLYALAAVLAVPGLALTGTMAGTLLVPPVALAAIGPILLARHVGHGRHVPTARL
ncbi:hypothetical protein [Streptomyces sp. WAC00263]|uniref:hypothetical protein n=1 Tax=Streptomyces sp. WAC00263 TaxID=1917422 RepID=UPI0015EF2F3F|nr:hypothetical protein [Streptomyces sp. WAC00263]KAF5990754.1 hypothetical protein BOG92_000980 [Streptomyces sp. WAC00263]